MDVPDACQSAKPGLGRYDSGPDMATVAAQRRGQATCYAEVLRAVALARAVDELSAEILPLLEAG